MGVELGGWSFGAQFGDLNNDGTLDLYLTNGYVSLSRTRSYWYDFSRVAGGNSKIIGDAANWPAMDGRSLSGYQQKKVWINDGAAKFVDVAQAVGATDTYDGRSVAMADLWNRGVLDVVVANQLGPLLIYKTPSSKATSGSSFRSLEPGAIAVRSGRRSLSIGMASNRYSRFPGEAALRRRTIAGCILAWERISRSRRQSSGGRREKCKPSRIWSPESSTM